MKIVHVLAVFASISLLLVGCSTSKQADKDVKIQVSEAKKGMESEKESISKTEEGTQIDSGAKRKATTDKPTTNLLINLLNPSIRPRVNCSSI